MSEVSSDWIDKWLHNKYFFYDSVAIAQDVGGPEPFEIFAYRVLPQRFDKRGVSPIELAAPSVTPLSEAFEFLGYDVVECWQKLEDGMPIECSPLSCNGMSAEIPVNRYCLIETLQQAFAIALRFGSESDGVEPGPYYLFEVWRLRQERGA